MSRLSFVRGIGVWAFVGVAVLAVACLWPSTARHVFAAQAQPCVAVSLPADGSVGHRELTSQTPGSAVLLNHWQYTAKGTSVFVPVIKLLDFEISVLQQLEKVEQGNPGEELKLHLKVIKLKAEIKILTLLDGIL